MPDGSAARFSRRRFLGAGAALAGTLGAGAALGACSTGTGARDEARDERIPFHGVHQAGVALARQAHLRFAAFDVTAPGRVELVDLLREWTDTAAAVVGGHLQPDTGEASGLAPSRLTTTFGFGPALFARAGDPYRLAARRPAALLDLPAFRDDEIDPARSGGDVGVQVCAEDPTVAFHALHALTRAATGAATLRWVQTGFVSTPGGGGTPRGVMGFKDGTSNVNVADDAELSRHVWVSGSDEPRWMRDGSYLVVRRIHIDLDHWDRSSRAEQEAVFGRRKDSGAPLTGTKEHDPPNFASDRIASDAHVRLSTPENNNGARLLRRSYSYENESASGGRGLDVGLFFMSYQRDPRTQFVPIQQRLADDDALNAFTTHVGSAVFAVPPGVRAPGGFVGEGLFTA